MKTILTPVDFSSITRSVIAAAAALARTQCGCIVLLNVTQPPLITAEYAPYLENLGQIVMAAKKAAARQLIRQAQGLKGEGLAVRTVHCTGSPVQFILQQADKLAADYIVMGSHGHTAFYDLLVGSTTHGVLLKSPCPVLVVPARKKLSRKEKK